SLGEPGHRALECMRMQVRHPGQDPSRVRAAWRRCVRTLTTRRNVEPVAVPRVEPDMHVIGEAVREPGVRGVEDGIAHGGFAWFRWATCRCGAPAYRATDKYRDSRLASGIHRWTMTISKGRDGSAAASRARRSPRRRATRACARRKC